MALRTQSAAFSCTCACRRARRSSPWRCTARSISAMPRALAASWARRSATFCRDCRAGHGPPPSAASSSRSRSTPPVTSGKHSKRTPSSSMVWLKGGIEPGVTPPMSAWCAREATKKSGLRAAAEEHRRHHGHVRQMRAAVIGAVEQPGIPRRHALRAHDRAHAGAHRAQVHRHVRRVGDQAAVRLKQCARVIEPLA